MLGLSITTLEHSCCTGAPLRSLTTSVLCDHQCAIWPPMLSSSISVLQCFLQRLSTSLMYCAWAPCSDQCMSPGDLLSVTSHQIENHVNALTQGEEVENMVRENGGESKSVSRCFYWLAVHRCSSVLSHLLLNVLQEERAALLPRNRAFFLLLRNVCRFVTPGRWHPPSHSLSHPPPHLMIVPQWMTDVRNTADQWPYLCCLLLQVKLQ